MSESSTEPVQDRTVPDEENCIVDALPSSSARQQPPLNNFDLEVYPPVEAELAWYDARERELGIKYRKELKAQKDREAREERKRSQARQLDGCQQLGPLPPDEGQQLGPLPPDCPDEDSDENSDEDYDEYCYKEIENLVLIEKSLIHSKALEEWDRKEKLFTSRVDRKSTKVGNLKNEVYQLIGFFSVFQGVVLTAVSQSSLLHCNNWWSPIGLSVLASVVTILAVAQKLLQISSLQKTISAEQRALQVAVRRGASLRRAGKAFVFMQLGKGSFARMPSLELTLRNDLKEGENVKVKEGNAGIFRQVATLTPGETYTLRHDPNATYREFVLITLPNKKELPVLSTDLFHELKEISVYKDGVTGPYGWKGTVSRRNPPALATEAGQANRRGRLQRLFSKFGL